MLWLLDPLCDCSQRAARTRRKQGLAASLSLHIQKSRGPPDGLPMWSKLPPSVVASGQWAASTVVEASWVNEASQANEHRSNQGGTCIIS